MLPAATTNYWEVQSRSDGNTLATNEVEVAGVEVRSTYFYIYKRYFIVLLTKLFLLKIA